MTQVAWCLGSPFSSPVVMVTIRGMGGADYFRSLFHCYAKVGVTASKSFHQSVIWEIFNSINFSSINSWHTSTLILYCYGFE
ncbi:hypothetical protein TNCV_3259811 [Trichonephila clavipes]|nr:hypothetical protein TNCV_3259811 [Trichonephila clavipes]